MSPKEYSAFINNETDLKRGDMKGCSLFITKGKCKLQNSMYYMIPFV